MSQNSLGLNEELDCIKYIRAHGPILPKMMQICLTQFMLLYDPWSKLLLIES